MNFFGVGGLELIVVFIIGLLVVGPVRIGRRSSDGPQVHD